MDTLAKQVYYYAILFRVVFFRIALAFTNPVFFISKESSLFNELKMKKTESAVNTILKENKVCPEKK